MRSLVPADSLVYLETNDLGAALQPIIDSKPFNEVAKKKPDLSALKGVQLAVAITGFETSEEKLNDEQSVGKIQPHFVAIADTHAWQFQTVRFAEQKLGAFVADIYDSEPTLEEHEKGGGHYLTWTAKDGRKAYAFVNRNLIYFGNDESSIDKCLAVARGEADSIAKGGKIAASQPDVLASGYVSTDGVAQIANLFALKFAQDASEEPEVQSAIAGVLPQILRNTITDVTWTATKTDQGYEDKWQIGMPSEVAQNFSEAFATEPVTDAQQDVSGQIVFRTPYNFQTATRYNLKTPQTAWKSVSTVASNQIGASGTALLSALGDAFFDEYGISDPQLFLSSLGGTSSTSSNIVTASLSADEQNRVVISNAAHKVTLDSMKKGMKMIFSGEDGWSQWQTPAGDMQVLFEGDLASIGSPDDIAKLKLTPGSGGTSDLLKRLAESEAPISTIGQDGELAPSVADMLSEKKSDDAKATSTYFSETRFAKSGIERKTTSDFGFIGWVIAQLAEE